LAVVFGCGVVKKDERPTMFYGNYTSSFSLDGMPMFNWTGVRPPEELKSYPMDVKTRILNNSVQVNAAP
jgi:hypothetical protein